jgi:hypothetical protein
VLPFHSSSPPLLVHSRPRLLELSTCGFLPCPMVPDQHFPAVNCHFPADHQLLYPFGLSYGIILCQSKLYIQLLILRANRKRFFLNDSLCCKRSKTCGFESLQKYIFFQKIFNGKE